MAADLGIAMVHQHYSLVDALSVWENVVLGEPARLDPSAARARVREIGEHYGLDVDPDARVGSLTAGQRQRVEIVKCLRRDPTILVFDEPTSVLTPAESEQLFSVLRRVVAEEGRTVALVSHKLDEVLQATDVISIMRQGRVVEHLPAADADARTLARAMVGREVSLRAEAAAFGLAEAVQGAAHATSWRTGRPPSARPRAPHPGRVGAGPRRRTQAGRARRRGRRRRDRRRGRGGGQRAAGAGRRAVVA